MAESTVVKAGEPRNVSRFESSLLRLLHFFLRRAPVQQALPLLESKMERPRCLSRAAVELIKDALGKGVVQILAQSGGWRKERFLRGDRIAAGRLWERTPPAELGLRFSPATLEMLIWITARKPQEEKRNWQPPDTVQSHGDVLMVYLIHESLRGSEVGAELARRPTFARNPLCRLFFPEDFGSVSAVPLDYRPWVEGVGACVLEALQPVLVERWFTMECDKGRLTTWAQMRELGQAQELALEAFLDAAEKAGRLDLTRFVLHAAQRLLTPAATPAHWVGSLRQVSQRLADRAETYRLATVFLRQMNRLQRWARNAEAVGYFDEGYRASQLYKADWQTCQGDVLAERAQIIIRQLDPLRQAEGQS